MNITQDAQDFLVALLWAYPSDDNGENPMDEKSIYDFTPEFVEGVESFIQGFEDYLEEREIEIPETPRSFGGNVYFSLSGHGAGFWDDTETKHLQAHLEAYSGDKYRFGDIGLDEDENGKLDLSIIPEHIKECRDKLFQVGKN